jgi:hypothetical protein
MATRLKTARQILNLLDRWFVAQKQDVRGADEGQKLWDVLTALRGPDMRKSYNLKNTTTSRIRTAAFPRLATRGVGAFGASFSQGKMIRVPAVLTTDHMHFIKHVKGATRALGLRIRKMKAPASKPDGPF